MARRRTIDPGLHAATDPAKSRAEPRETLWSRMVGRWRERPADGQEEVDARQV